MERALGLSARSCHDLRMRKWGWKGVLELSGWKEAKYIVMRVVNDLQKSAQMGLISVAVCALGAQTTLK